jgi:Mg/Co/Ni transporter MgtE
VAGTNTRASWVQYTDSEEDTIAESAKQAAARKRAEKLDSVLSEAWSRGKWLLGLLVLQSMSSVVLDSYHELLQKHLVITLFLTMLVGAGGNAGNQSAIKVSFSMSPAMIRFVSPLRAAHMWLHGALFSRRCRPPCTWV